MLAVLLLLVQGAAGPAEPPVIVDIHNLATHEHRVSGFVLRTPQTLHIAAVGAEPWPDQFRKRDDSSWQDDEQTTWPAAAWILDARTRAVVWDLRAVETRREANGLRHFDDTLRLPAGTYEAHYASFPSTLAGFSLGKNGDVTLSDLMRLGRRARYGGPYVENGLYREFGITIQAAGRPATAEEMKAAVGAFHASAVATVTPDPDGAGRQGFEVIRPAAVEIYAVGELTPHAAFDSCWVVNLATHKPVWTMAYDGTEPAGGSARNRAARETLRLPPGRYVAYYVRHETHSGSYNWNRMPPTDPEFWGLAIRLNDRATRDAVRPFDYRPVPEGQTIVSLIGVGDNALRFQGFTLRRPLDVHVYALGEASGEELVDYAWIVDAERHTRVWTMRYDETSHAGGAEKNRLADTTIHLSAGTYVVYYRSDGSHSAAGWNAAPPLEQHYWGVSLFPASGRLRRADVRPFGPMGAGTALASLVPMGDNEDAHAPFRLSARTRLEIYALGESSDTDMVDYGWIEDSVGNRVWEMKYGDTEYAGGDDKNRMLFGVVELPAGSYVLRYMSDGAHSHSGWNADAPADPDNWGIAVLAFGPHEHRSMRQARSRFRDAGQDRR